MTDHYLGVLLEDIDSKLAIIMEGQSVQATSLKLKAVDERLQVVESDARLIRRIVTDQSTASRSQTQRLNGHETRISKLESA